MTFCAVETLYHEGPFAPTLEALGVMREVVGIVVIATDVAERAMEQEEEEGVG